ncbi:Dual specificity protein kinase FUZ7 [Termitomyces sp. J132]|nr:Dual specificity protein kinase FUZ7 [Termitomyces sp. J132]
MSTPLRTKRNFKALQIPPLPLKRRPPPLGDAAPVQGILSPAVDSAVNSGRHSALIHATLAKMELEPAAPVEITDLKNADLKNLAELGHGNGGSVMKVEHVPTGTVMAKKIVLIDAQPSVRKQILRELQIMHSCKSPYIVSTYSAFLSEPNICICMEFMDKGSFDSISTTLGAIDVRVVRQLAYVVLQGLTYLIDDIKPSNVLFNSRGEIKLCDFGVSGELINSIANTFVGTSIYMSVKRIQGAEYSVKSDVWSLGISLIELATSRFPFSDSCRTARRRSRYTNTSTGNGSGETMSIIELMHQIVKEPAPRLGSGFALEEEEFVDACLLKDLDKRKAPKDLLEYKWMQQAKKSTFNLKEWAATF